MKTFGIEWRIIAHPARRIRTARHAFLARREARERKALRHEALEAHARRARAHAAQFDETDQIAKVVYGYWTRQIVRHRETARYQRELMNLEQAERERYHG